MHPQMLLLVLVCIFLVGLIVHVCLQRPDSDKLIVDRSIGNYLSEYFATMGLASFHGRDFDWPYTDEHSYFLQQLPRRVPFNPDIQKALLDNGFKGEFVPYCPASYWVVDSQQKHLFWEAMKPFVYDMYTTMFAGVDIPLTDTYEPVIHYRCSDAPFVKNIHYYFQRYAFFEQSLTDLGYSPNHDGSSTTVRLLACHTHNTDAERRQKCALYRQNLQEFLEQKGWTVIVQCKTPLEDFATMLTAPAVISTSSSFSFMAGYFGRGVFVSEGHYNDFSDTNPNHREVIYCDTCPWNYHGYSLRHYEVPDYADTDHVMSMLKK